MLGYLSGSVPYSLLLGLTFKSIDIRKHGSGNVGATNAGRVLGKRFGIVCFLLDVLKGAIPVALAGQFLTIDGTATQWQWLAVAGAAVLGHVFPIWLKFKGGKGVATGFGVLLGCWPILTVPAVGALVTWIIVAAIWRYVSLASMVAAAMLPLYLLATQSPISDYLPFVYITVLLAALVVLRHLTNLKRLLAGTESKLGQKK